MAHIQYMPGDPRLVDQLVYELKSKGIFDQFRKDCISDVDTRPAYQNLRQRVESSVSLFLSRQTWKPDLNKNQLREKLRKHILDGNYLEQGVERIVDQVVNPKVSSVFIPQVEDLVYNYLGIPRKKSTPETSYDKGNSSTDLLPTDLEAVSPGSVKSNDDKDEIVDEHKDDNMDIDSDDKPKDVNDISMHSVGELEKDDTHLSGISDLTSHDSESSLGKMNIPMPESEDINLENIPSPENSPTKIDLDSIEMPKEEDPIELKNIPLPDESPKEDKEEYFKPINSEDDSSSDSSIIRNMSPLTPIRNFNNENSCDAQQAFENDDDNKGEEKQEPNTFRFTIEAKSPEKNCDVVVEEPKIEKTEEPKEEHTDLSYQFNEQVNINTFTTPLYDDSSNSHNLQIDYESDVNSKTNLDKIPLPEGQSAKDCKKESSEEKKSHKSSHRSRDSQRHSSSSKDRKYDSKSSSSKDRRDSKTDRKPSKDDQSKSKSSSDKSKDRGDKKESKDSKDSKHRSSSHKSSSSKDFKDSKHRSSSSSQKHSSKTDEKKSSSTNNKDKDKEKDKTADKSLKEHRSSKDSKSRSDKDKKSKKDDKDKKDKKDTDDHYNASGRGNHSRRSTDRDSNDGSSSSKGSHNPPSSKSSESKANKGNSSKSDDTSPSSKSPSPSDKDTVIENNTEVSMYQPKPIVRVDTHLERPIGTPPRLPFVPDVTLKKPKFAANLAEAKRLMKMRKFLDEEQKRMNQEAALLLEFQANVRPSLSQVYSSIPGPELEFACISNVVEPAKPILETNYAEVQPIEEITDVHDSIEMELCEMNRETKEIVPSEVPEAVTYEPIELKADFEDSEKLLNEISKKVYGVMDESIEEYEEYEAELKPEHIISEEINSEHTKFEVTIITEEIIDNEIKETLEPKYEIEEPVQYNEKPLEYFAESEKFDAELERAKFESFLKEYLTTTITDKLYLINCNSYEESIMKEVAETFGNFEIINYHKNGFKNKNVFKNVNVSNEIVLPLDRHTPIENNFIKSTGISPILSPVKSECSFELSSDYDARLEEMVNKTSRQEIMEIILGGGVPDESPSKMPKIDYCMDDNFERNVDFKRKLSVDSLDNNNGHVLTPNKMRKLSDSDQISSTTEETPVNLNLSKTNSVRSKYLGKARRVGLSRPRRTVQPNSPSSDKSVENYDTSESTPNGKLNLQRKVQRYATSDLYKPKLHYLSRRNNIS